MKMRDVETITHKFLSKTLYTWSLTIFIDFDFYPLTTQGPTGLPGCNCTRIYTPTLFWKGGRSEKLDAYKGLANTSHQKKILNLVLKETFLYKW